MTWSRADCEAVAHPRAATRLLTLAIGARPGDPALFRRLGAVHIDLYDFCAAREAFAAAYAIDADDAETRQWLASCLNACGDPAAVLELLPDPRGAPELYEYGLALRSLGRKDDAETQFRAALHADPGHRRACHQLAALLRRSGRTGPLIDLCETLVARGVDHAQLLLDWGYALAIDGQDDKARALLLRRERIAVIEPAADAAMTCAALAEELLGNPFRIDKFPSDEANRGSSRVHALLAGPRPELMRDVLIAIQAAVDHHVAMLAPLGAFDPWMAARPARAHLRPWGLIQRDGDYEAWHSHRGGWLSGVFYVRIPEGVTERGAGPGCIEFGPPPSLGEAMPRLIDNWRHAPRAGELLLAPSHYHHRTIPSGIDQYRISLAFDVVPDA